MYYGVTRRLELLRSVRLDVFRKVARTVATVF